MSFPQHEDFAYVEKHQARWPGINLFHSIQFNEEDYYRHLEKLKASLDSPDASTLNPTSPISNAEYLKRHASLIADYPDLMKLAKKIQDVRPRFCIPILH